MKLGEFGVGKITKQNATKDAPIGSEYSNVKKLGLGSGKPKIHNKKATKNSDPNTLFNLGIGESEIQELKIEKPDPKDTLGVQRKDMPQVKSDDYAQFIAYLKKNGATFTKETIPARELKAMQKEFSDEGILKQMMKNIEQGPNRKAVIASSDDYILDGHHRWLVAVNTGDDLNVYRVNMPAWELYELVNKFEKTYYKDIYERGSIGVPLASGLVMKLFPHRPLKIAKSTPGKLNYNEVSQSQDSLGSQINFPGFEKTKVKPKPKYNPVPKKDKSILDKVKGWFTDDINEAYVLRLEDDDNMLVLHIRDTKSGERVEVRGKPNYEIDYDENDELHQLLDVIGKASNISDLMNGKIVNINPKHPDGPKSYAAIEKVMGEEWSAKYKRSINCDNPKGFSQKAHCAGRKKNEGAEITMWTNPEYQGSDVDDEYYNKQPAKIIDISKLTPFEPADKMDDEISAANMGKLVKAIQAGEKINPIIVVPYEGKLLIIDGHHRYFAHIKAGADKIPVVMADPKDLTWRDDVPVDEAKVDEGVNDPHIFKAVFLAGGPGSGKSFVSKNILGGTGLKTMNSDDVYEILMKKQDLALDPDTIASPQGQEIRDKAKLMTKKRSVNWIDGRLGLLIDGTGKDVAKYQKQAEFLRMLGYDVAMIFVNTSEEVAQQRNRQRARSLKPEMVSAMWNDVQQNLMKFQQIFGAGRFHIIDNSGGLEDLDRQKNFDKVYNETQRFLNTPPSKPAAKKWIQNQKAQNDATQRSERTTTNNTDSDGGVRTTN
jgi:dephospho-CoA kinase